MLGLPGDVYNFVSGIIPQTELGKKASEKVPTSQKLQEFSEKASLGYTKPKTRGEEVSDEIVGDVASFILPGGQRSAIGRILIPIGVDLGKNSWKRRI